MLFPYLKGLINKEAFISIYILLFLGLFPLSYMFGLDLQQLVSEHFLGHKSGDFFFYFCKVSGAASLQIRSVSFGARSVKYNYRSGLFVQK